MLNVPRLCPAGMVRLAGRVAAPSELDSVTEMPPGVAGRLSVTVPVAEEPPVTVLGDTESALMIPSDGAAACTVSDAVNVLEEAAEMVTVTLADTEAVVTGNVTLVAPSPISTEPGTDAAALLLANVTRTPPVPAGDPRVSVPVAGVPPDTEDGDIESAVRVPPVAGAGWMPRMVVTVFSDVAESVAVWLAETAAVVTRNVPEVCPAGISRDAGRATELNELASPTCTPPAGAAANRVTVPVALLPPATGLGATDMAPMAACTGAAACTVSVADTLLADEADIVTTVVAVTVDVGMEKDPLLLPAGITRLTGTWAAAWLLNRFTSTPPVPAGEESVTVPDAVPPPAIVCGET